MKYAQIILIAISLSLDAFGLALAYGLMNFSKRKIISISLTVGVFHFFMPLFGLLSGQIVFEYIPINPKIVLSVILFLVIIEMIKSINSKTESENLNILGILLFALFVSLDSFSLGIGLAYITNEYVISAIIFSITSFIFTIIGFFLGKFVSFKFNRISKIIGILIMFTLLIYNLCK